VRVHTHIHTHTHTHTNTHTQDLSFREVMSLLATLLCSRASSSKPSWDIAAEKYTNSTP
jgi:hypothetical protein